MKKYIVIFLFLLSYQSYSQWGVIKSGYGVLILNNVDSLINFKLDSTRIAKQISDSLDANTRGSASLRDSYNMEIRAVFSGADSDYVCSVINSIYRVNDNSRPLYLSPVAPDTLYPERISISVKRPWENSWGTAIADTTLYFADDCIPIPQGAGIAVFYYPADSSGNGRQMIEIRKRTVNTVTTAGLHATGGAQFPIPLRRGGMVADALLEIEIRFRIAR